MKLQFFAAIFPISFILASAQSTSYGSASYTEITTVSQKGPTPTVVFGGPAMPTASTPAIPPNVASYQLNSSFEITNKPVTRIFNWTIAARYGAPDGYYRSYITINGQMPGPLVEANEGDTLVFNIYNTLPNQTTSIHWHGMYQNGTAFMDGVPGVTQCPIQSGKSFTYRFNLTQYGTYWYHSHSSTQYTDGLFGPLIIHSVNDPLVRGTDFNYEQVIILNDWYHDQASTIVEELLSVNGYMGTAAAPSPQSGLINGHGVYNCSALSSTVNCTTLTPPEIIVAPNAKTRFRLINSGSHAQFYFSVDEHTLNVVEADGTPISGPSAIHRVPLHNGQRYSAIIDTNVGSAGDSYWLRAEMDTNCFRAIDPTLNATAFAILRYGSNSTSNPTSLDWTDVLGDHCIDLVDADLVPLVPKNAPSVVDQRVAFDSELGSVLYNNVSYSRFLFNQTTYVNYIYQPFLETVANNGSLNSTNVLYAEFPDDVGTGDIIVNNLDPFLDHPYHLHGIEFFIVARGSGNLSIMNAESIDYNITNPARRDTLVIPAGSYAVLRFANDLPGVWILHCHIAWHLAEGFLGAIVARPNAIAHIGIPSSVNDLCAALPPGQSLNTTAPGRKRGSFVISDES
ncbi:multicopper oxidase [Piloderma croceum F 1598]|uniref:Multicopper oxidase n=1 Tax=Piloderma croceum (strain F 1598) TaxID=765440 RepID=A0A0C3AUW3_PILCF|nr:multicopper oxidase [Piloderma croceum F 1598]